MSDFEDELKTLLVEAYQWERNWAAQEIQRATKAADAQTLHSMVHRLRPSAAMMNDNQLRHLLIELGTELQRGANAIEEVEPLLVQVRQALESPFAPQI